MNESILNSIKKLLGIDSSYTNFDADIILHINTAFGILYQMGVGPTMPFSIEGATSTWSDFLGTATNYSIVKTWMFLKVKSLFDPTASSIIDQSYTRTMSELEFRMLVEVMKDEENQNG